jgi:membrane protease YdiL (CAAX protease family)
MFSILDCCGIFFLHLITLIFYEILINSLSINDRYSLGYIYAFIKTMFFYLPVTLFYFYKSKFDSKIQNSSVIIEFTKLLKTYKFIFICCILCIFTLIPGLSLFFVPFDIAKKYAQDHINIFGNWPIINYLTLVTVIPLSEELIFRGILFNVIKKYNKILSYLLTSIIFYYYHGEMRSEWNFITSILFCWVYDKYKTIVAPITLHMIYNALFICNLLLEYFILIH